MTRQVLYKLQFYGTAQDPVQVGDKLEFAGTTGTVASIEADLIDITGIGADYEFTLGGVVIELAANAANVKGAA